MPAPARRPLRISSIESVAFCSTRRRSVCVTGVRASASRRFAARTSGSFGHCGFAAWRPCGSAGSRSSIFGGSTSGARSR